MLLTMQNSDVMIRCQWIDCDVDEPSSHFWTLLATFSSAFNLLEIMHHETGGYGINN